MFLSASLLGARRATCSVFVYILLGAVGLPVFSAFSGGLGFLLGPTGGYIIGFLFTAFVVGFITEKLGKTVGVLALSMTIGILLCYAFGKTTDTKSKQVVINISKVETYAYSNSFTDMPVNVIKIKTVKLSNSKF